MFLTIVVDCLTTMKALKEDVNSCKGGTRQGKLRTRIDLAVDIIVILSHFFTSRLSPWLRHSRRHDSLAEYDLCNDVQGGYQSPKSALFLNVKALHPFTSLCLILHLPIIGACIADLRRVFGCLLLAMPGITNREYGLVVLNCRLEYMSRIRGNEQQFCLESTLVPGFPILCVITTVIFDASWAAFGDATHSKHLSYGCQTTAL